MIFIPFVKRRNWSDLSRRLHLNYCFIKTIFTAVWRVSALGQGVEGMKTAEWRLLGGYCIDPVCQ